MISRAMHSRVIKPAAITGRDSTARYSAMRGPTAAWRAMAQGGPHQEAMAISLSGETFTVEAMEIAKTEGCDVVDLKTLDFVVLSHRHSDHMAGLNYVLSVNPKASQL
jgi:glyoxylase-like metal-dependent hydrolase (beta-lactamase superfamily II)